jgi:hypothetical protein
MRAGGHMAQDFRDVTETELAVLQDLWDLGPCVLL